MNSHVSPSAAATELLRRRRARESLIGFSQAIDIPGKPIDEDEDCERFLNVETGVAAHHVLLMGAVQRCIEKPNGRLMVFMPPGSAKSTYVSVVTPAWAMGKWPGFRVIGASYASDLARKLGRRCRSIVKQKGYAGLFGTGLSAESSGTSNVGVKGSQSIQSHAHGASMAAAGLHSHSGSTGTGGFHTHSGRTDEAGAHAHTVGTAALGSSGGNLPVIRFEQDNPVSTSFVGGHIHGVTIDGAGAHGHAIGADGQHTHPITIDATGGSETRPRFIALLICIKA